MTAFTAPGIAVPARIDALALVKLVPLMERTSGRPEIVVGLLDGPVAMGLSALAGENIQQAGSSSADCSPPGGFACGHGTLVAGILSARRSSSPAGICPGCTLLVRPIFGESSGGDGAALPQATPEELAQAIRESVEAGAHVINVSAAVVGHRCSRRLGERRLAEALDQAMQHGCLVVAAAGNQGDIGSSMITEHPWVIPVAAYSLRGSAAGRVEFGRVDRQARLGRARRAESSVCRRPVNRCRGRGPAWLPPLLLARSPCCGRCFLPRRRVLFGPP